MNKKITKVEAMAFAGIIAIMCFSQGLIDTLLPNGVF
jgi:hypothetical protein